MVQVPTNYRMGTGLAATIMGQQAGLESEQMGLANLMKGMQMPAEALKGQEAAMLMQDPNYLQQKTANTLIELSNTYQANDFQQTLNAANRVKIQLDAAGGDKAKEQQIVMNALSALKMDPNSEFGQYAMRDPRGALDKFIQGTEVAMTRSAGQLGKERLQGMQDTAAMDIAKYKGGIDLQQSRISAGSQAASADKALRGQMIQYSGQLRQELDGLNNNITKLEGKELDSAIMQDFMNRGKKDATQADVDKAKGELKATLIARRDSIQSELDSVRGEVRGKLGMKQPAGTREDPIKL